MIRRARFVAVAIFLLSQLSCGSGDGVGGGKTVRYEGETGWAEVSYSTSPPEHAFDSVKVNVGIRVSRDLETDSLAFEMLPAQSGWARAVDTMLVRDAEGWYRSAIWICPTEAGQFVLSWQTLPFTGFTYYLAARYDSLGQLVEWDEVPDPRYPPYPALVRDTMEVVYRFWPHVWYRRVHLVKRTDAPREWYVITQSYQRGPGVSGRILGYSANLKTSPDFPLRTRQWDEAGWVVDTASIWVRDTLVSWLAWTYDEFLDNWESNYSLFREWKHDRQPELYFQLDANGHMKDLWTFKPEGKYIAAKMYADTSRPSFDSLKKAFIRAPLDTAP
jgi:hypothetical protein